MCILILHKRSCGGEGGGVLAQGHQVGGSMGHLLDFLCFLRPLFAHWCGSCLCRTWIEYLRDRKRAHGVRPEDQSGRRGYPSFWPPTFGCNLESADPHSSNVSLGRGRDSCGPPEHCDMDFSCSYLRARKSMNIQERRGDTVRGGSWELLLGSEEHRWILSHLPTGTKEWTSIMGCWHVCPPAPMELSRGTWHNLSKLFLKENTSAEAHEALCVSAQL